MEISRTDFCGELTVMPRFIFPACSVYIFFFFFHFQCYFNSAERIILFSLTLFLPPFFLFLYHPSLFPLFSPTSFQNFASISPLFTCFSIIMASFTRTIRPLLRADVGRIAARRSFPSRPLQGYVFLSLSIRS